MPSIKRSSPAIKDLDGELIIEQKSHYHMLYLLDTYDPQGLNGEAAMVEDHTHAVQYIPAVPPVMEVDGTMVQPGVPSKYKLAKANGHFHEIDEIVLVPKKDDRSKEDIASEGWALFAAAKQYEKDFRTQAEEDEKFYEGDQWEKSDRQALVEQDRPVLTYNEIEPKMDLLSGVEKQNRTDIVYHPVEDGDEVAADIATLIAKYVTETNRYNTKRSEVFEDMGIVGRGILDCYVDYTVDLNGIITIDHYEWDKVYFGPHNKKDLSDCEYLVKTALFSWDKLKNMYPNRADELETDSVVPEDVEEDTQPVINIPGHRYEGDNKVNENIPALAVKDTAKDKRIIEVHKKEFFQTVFFKDPNSDFTFDSSVISSADTAQLKELKTLMPIKKINMKIRIIAISGKVVLTNEVSEIDSFELVVAYAKKRKAKVWSKITPLKDPQREINKRKSQSVDVLNRANGYGFYYDGDTFANTKDERDFNDNISKPGFKVRVKNLNKIPIEKQGTKFPGEIIQMEEHSSNKLKEISNINNEMLGQSQRQESGVAIAEKKRQGLIGNEFLFDNLSMAQRQVGILILKYIPKVWTPSKINRLINRQLTKAQKEAEATGGQIDNQEVIKAKYTPEEISKAIAEIANLDFTKYDVVVGESDYSPTKKIANFLMMYELARSGAPIPPEMIIIMSDLPPKEKKLVMGVLQQQQQAEAQVQQSKNQTEITKTRIANQDSGQPPQDGSTAGPV